MSRSSNISRSDNMRVGRAYARSAPFSGSLPGILLSHLLVVRWGAGSKQGYPAPAAAAANNIATAQAVAGAGYATLNGTLVTDGVAYPDVPRNIQLDSSNVGDTTQTVTLSGVDAVGNLIEEDVALNGTTNVFSQKAFKELHSAYVDGAMDGNLTIGTGTALGLPVRIDSVADVLLVNEGGDISEPTVVAAASGNADGLGTITPETAPNGSVVYTALVVVNDSTESAYEQPEVIL